MTSTELVLNEIDARKATETIAVPFEPTPGIHIIDNDTYHGLANVPSKSGLQTLHTKTPFHFRYGERVHKSHFDLGDGAHAAILEPSRFDADFIRGPDDRRGNKWKDALAEAEAGGRTLLTSGDYEIALRVRDSAHANPTIRALVKGCLVEHSAFYIDEETQVLCRVRPDAYSADLALIGDLKTTTDAGGFAFSKSVNDYGYHFQEAMYSYGWQEAGGGGVEGFVFMAVEKTAPYPVAVYELERTAVAEGYAIYREAIGKYAECAVAEAAIRADFAENPGAWTDERLERAIINCWPGYPAEVQRLDIPKWGYRLTNRQEG